VEENLLTREDLCHPEVWVRQKIFANCLCRTVREESMFRALVPNFSLSKRFCPLDWFEALEERQAHGQGQSKDCWKQKMDHGKQEKDRRKQNTASTEEEPINGGTLWPGLGVKIHGLKGSPEFNGEEGFLEEWDPAGGRWIVRLDSGEVKALKEENLQAEVNMLQHNGKTYTVGHNNLLLDPQTHEAVAVWNPETQDIDEIPDIPVAMIEVEGRACIMAQDGLVIDQQTREPIGRMNRETREVEPLEKGSEHEGDVAEIHEVDMEERMNALEWVERGKKLFGRGFYNQAADAYNSALETCESERAVEVDLECEILRCRAGCWVKLRDYSSLLKDAQRLLKYDDSDAEALEWQRRARSLLRGT